MSRVYDLPGSIMKQAFVLLASLSLVVITSCRDTPTAPSSSQIYGQTSGQPLPNIDNLGEIGGLFGTYLTKQTVGRDRELATAQFEADGLDGGIVGVNNFTLSKQLVGGTLLYTSAGGVNATNDIPDVDFDGSTHQFYAEGNNRVPEIDVSVESATDFELQQPTVFDVINKADNLDVVWTGGSGASDERVLIIISSQGTNNASVTKDIPNTGSYSFRASDLNDVSGSAVFTLIKYRMATDVVQGKTYVALSEIIYRRSITIVE